MPCRMLKSANSTDACTIDLQMSHDDGSLKKVEAEGHINRTVRDTALKIVPHKLYQKSIEERRGTREESILFAT